MYLISKIKDVWGFFGSDLNFHTHYEGSRNLCSDYPNLTPEKMLDWYKAIDANMVWSWIKLGSGHATFPSKVLPHMKHFEDNFFQKFCRLAKDEGMYVVGYTCGGFDTHAFEEHPEWFEAHGSAFACLNSPHWQREFSAIQEALTVFPCDGLFYDMVIFSGECKCQFCRQTYEEFYGQELPETLDGMREAGMIERFRFDTFKRWVERATSAARSIVPEIEITVNQQWHRPYGVPFELLHAFDWYYCEFGTAEWVGEILRAWGEKPLLSGNALNPPYAAHLMARRISPLAYSCLTDYRSGKFAPVSDPRVKPIRQMLGNIRQCEMYLKDAEPLKHTAVLFTEKYDLSSYDLTKPWLLEKPEKIWDDPLLTRTGYIEKVTEQIREVTRMGLTSTAVEIVEQLTPSRLECYELIFAPELAWLDTDIIALLHAWVEKGGILVAGGPFTLMDQSKNVQEDFSARELLGVQRNEGPLKIFSELTSLRQNGALTQLKTAVPFSNCIVCNAFTAKAVGFGSVGVDNNVPLIWRNDIGEGNVFFITGRPVIDYEIPSGIQPDLSKCAHSLRHCLKALVFPYLHKATVKTDMDYPVEVWLNRQPAEKRLVLHVVSYERQLNDQQVSIHADLISDNKLVIVYPASKSMTIAGRQEEGYVHFVLPDVYEHIIGVLAG